MMNARNLELAAGLVDQAYIDQAAQAISARQNLLTVLLSQRKLPSKGWDDITIEAVLQDFALMDSNNFLSNVGVGEREARIASKLVAKRHYNLCHGIGRSGEITALQPKAAGSSLLVKITNCLVLDALHIAGLLNVKSSIIIPCATGKLNLTKRASKNNDPPPPHTHSQKE